MLPEDMAVFRRLERVFTETCQKWGYQEIRTPVLEYLHLFTSAGTLTPARLSQTYSFLDWDGWSGERVVLRPDSTIPAARLYVDNLTRQEKARLFYIQNVFTFEPTGRENREKWQCGAEFIGGQGAIADAEMIFMAADILKAMGIGDIEIQISHAGLIKSLLGQIEPDPAKQAELFDRILDGNVDSLNLDNGGGKGLGEAINLMLNYSGQAEGFLRNLKATASSLIPSLKPPLENFIAVVELLTPLNGRFRVNISSGRGFEYYTGIMVQFNSAGMRIGGGGRYDDLVALIGGTRIPACGYALYLDRLVGLVKLPSGVENKAGVAVVIRDGSPALTKAAFSLCRQLRDKGYTAVIGESEDVNRQTYYLVLLEAKGDGEVVYALGEKGFRAKFDSANDLIRELKNIGKISAA